MAIKPEILQQILADGDAAKHLPNMPNTYTPEEYNKVMAKKRAVNLVNDGMHSGENYRPNISEGAVEFDENGNLKKFNRTAPMMIDLNRYTANRYKVQKVAPMNAKKQGLAPGTYILVVFGEAIINGINNSDVEMKGTIKAHRYIRTTHEGTITEEMIEQMPEEEKADMKVGDPFNYTSWDYVKSEFIKASEVYDMTGKINPDEALLLLQQLDKNNRSNATEGAVGDSLDDIQ